MAKFKYVYGVMNSGKSQELLRVWFSYTGGDVDSKSVLVLTPEVDDRHGVGMVTTRAGQQIAANVIEDISTLDYYLDNLDVEVECILVDEVQFLSSEMVYRIKDFTLKHDIPVLAFGLLSDFRNNIFDGSAACMVVAEEIMEIITICSKCRSKAIMNVRLDSNGHKVTEGDQIAVGDETYTSVCHKHWNEL